jgi:hypothetical protein
VGGEPRVETGRCEVVDGAPLAATVHSADLQSSRSCDAQLARATLAITGWVQKVSNLILNIRVRDAGRLLAGASVDPRRNGQQSRSRALADRVANRPGPGAS